MAFAELHCRLYWLPN